MEKMKRMISTLGLAAILLQACAVTPVAEVQPESMAPMPAGWEQGARETEKGYTAVVCIKADMPTTARDFLMLNGASMVAGAMAPLQLGEQRDGDRVRTRMSYRANLHGLQEIDSYEGIGGVPEELLREGVRNYCKKYFLSK